MHPGGWLYGAGVDGWQVATVLHHRSAGAMAMVGLVTQPLHVATLQCSVV